MVGDDHAETPDRTGLVSGSHKPVSRRSVLRTAAGASAAGLVAGMTLGALPAAADTADEASTGPVVVHVRDARTGEMDIFAGTSQTRLRDPALAARLVRASR